VCPGIIPEPPLGWALSRDSRDAMDALLIGHGGLIKKYTEGNASQAEFLDCYHHIQSEFGRLMSILR
jgi:hypothetical protein